MTPFYFFNFKVSILPSFRFGDGFVTWDQNIGAEGEGEESNFGLLPFGPKTQFHLLKDDCSDDQQF